MPHGGGNTRGGQALHPCTLPRGTVSATGVAQVSYWKVPMPIDQGSHAGVKQGWEPTRYAGYRRTGVAQRKSAAQIKRRSVARNHPPVLIRLAERLGLPECPYVIRWRIETPIGSIRLHHWLGPDDDRAYHDHPWWFITLVLCGGYTDYHPCPTPCDDDCDDDCHEWHQPRWKQDHNPGICGKDHMHAGSVRYRPALHRHTVVPDPGGAWTILVTGPKVRNWGFWLDGKFRKANKWFATYGHHPCQLWPPNFVVPER